MYLVSLVMAPWVGWTVWHWYSVSCSIAKIQFFSLSNTSEVYVFAGLCRRYEAYGMDRCSARSNRYSLCRMIVTQRYLGEVRVA